MWVIHGYYSDAVDESRPSYQLNFKNKLELFSKSLNDFNNQLKQFFNVEYIVIALAQIITTYCFEVYFLNTLIS